ncbi:MAG TPA: 50S ribosomal protein L15 [Candidatus Paceibacterota bacterium]|nr:50S ribosomal protein L15 [Candidatus Paceibacterota bacterium]
MQLHNITPTTKNKKRMQVGRGGKRGKTSGKGTKGQKSRAGRKLRPELRDIIKKLPKQRGRGKNINQAFQQKPVVINLATIDLAFEKGTLITPATLVAEGIIRIRKGEKPMVKILGTGDITKAFEFSGVTFSAAAKEKIEKAGGKIS